jgi:transposase-like protein
VDQDGQVLDIFVQRWRDTHAANKFFRKLLKGCQYVPRVIITDKLKSYDAAKREILPGVDHRQHRYLNNRAENGSVAKTEQSVRRTLANPLYAATPNIWLKTRFSARTSPLAIPSSWPLYSMCMGS